MRFDRLRHIIVMVISLSVVLAICLPVLPISAAAGTAIISVDSATQEVTPGAQFTININMQPNSAIAGVQFNLSFNPNLVTVNSISEGDLLKQNNADTYFSPGNIDNNAGTITGVAGTIIVPGETVSTPGSFAVITMTAGSKEGTCQLNLSNVIAGDLNAQSVPINAVNGNIIIGSNSINQPPILNAIGDKTLKAGSLLTFAISATDPEGDPLTYSASNLPSGASFDPITLVFSWTPTTSQVGTYPALHFEVSDGNLTDSGEITITDLNDAVRWRWRRWRRRRQKHTQPFKYSIYD
jgi:hypothetical protein